MKKTKNFSFGKIALMAFMILAAGAVLATPVSAGQHVEEIGPYDVYAIGEWSDDGEDHFDILGRIEERYGTYVAWIGIKLEVSNTAFPFGPWEDTVSNNWQISEGWKGYWHSGYDRELHNVKTTLTSSTGHSGYSVYILYP